MSIYTPVKALTELGEEKRCMACGEYWPADAEFFDTMRSSCDGLTPRCVACIREKRWQQAPQAACTKAMGGTLAGRRPAALLLR